MAATTWRALPLAAAALLATLPSPSPAATLEPGDAAPRFILRTETGEKVTLDDLRGQVVVLNFWATWCVPCRAEMPTLDTFYRRHRRQGLAVFAISTEDPVPSARLRALSASLAFPIVTRLIGSAYQVLGGLPTSYVIDRRGVIRYAESGAFDEAELDAVLRPLLAEAPPG